MADVEKLLIKPKNIDSIDAARALRQWIKDGGHGCDFIHVKWVTGFKYCIELPQQNDYTAFVLMWSDMFDIEVIEAENSCRSVV